MSLEVPVESVKTVAGVQS